MGQNWSPPSNILPSQSKADAGETLIFIPNVNIFDLIGAGNWQNYTSYVTTSA